MLSTCARSKWNDGTPVTAQDFVYSWRRTVNPKTEAEYSYLFPGSRTPMPSKTAKSRFPAWGSRPRAKV
ncbi:ABC transporter substrate-binding protein [Lactobacillus delbrueckii]|nr:ABC transporter substrate-binding protein [Lactobacillus delbrueckii]WKZ99231.1 ABC transporter substrate-binding protein [Lactobacillus delbrueckii]